MRLLSAILLSACLLAAGCGQNTAEKEVCDGQKIYFFYQTACPHCHDAAKYIKNKYPHLAIEAIDVNKDNNMALLQKAAKKYEITERMGTPLICFGDNHIMGWSEQNKRLFDMFVQPFLQQ